MTARATYEALGPVDLAMLEGEVDMAAARGLEPELLRCARASRAMVLDLSRVSFLDSGGTRLVDHVLRECRRRGVPVRVAAPPGSAALATLTICGFPDDVVEDTAAAALAAVEPAGA